MTLTEEQIRKAMACKTADELLALAKSWGFEMTLEQAEEYIAGMQTRELTEKELKQVAGGQECPYECCAERRDCKWWNPHCGGQSLPDDPCGKNCPEVWY